MDRMKENSQAGCITEAPPVCVLPETNRHSWRGAEKVIPSSQNFWDDSVKRDGWGAGESLQNLCVPCVPCLPRLPLLRFITWLCLTTETLNLLKRKHEITTQPATWCDSKTTTRAFQCTLSGYLFCAICIIGCVLEALDNARNAEWPSKAQQVSQVAEGAAEQDWPSKGAVHGQPNGGTPVGMVLHLFLENRNRYTVH